MPDVLVLLAQIAGILVVARLVGRGIALLGQPYVVGEMLAGILLGPSFLGWIAPDVWRALFPVASLGFLSALSQIGLVFYMFLVGLELDTRHLRGAQDRLDDGGDVLGRHHALDLDLGSEVVRHRRPAR